MAQNHDLETIKKVLRSLLISARHGLSERDLLRDYQQVTGERLSYRVFGHETFMSFLRSIPDVVRIVPNLSSGVLLFGEIGENKDVQRVASLVARSKVSRSKLNIRSMNTVSRPPSCPPSRVIPASVKLKFRTLMLSYPNGMPMDKFLDAFAKRFGYYINISQMGFIDIRSALATVPDIVKVEFNEPLNQFYVKGVQQTTRIFCSGQSAVNCQQPPVNSQPSAVNNQLPIKSAVNTKLPVNNQSSMNSLETSPPKTVPPPVKEPVSRTLSVTETRKLARQMRMLLKCYPGGLCVSRIPVEYKLVFKETLSLDRLGYTNVVQFLSSMPEVCVLQRTSATGNWIVFAREEGMLRGDQPYSAGIPKEVANRIRRVLSDNPDGILLSKFSTVYKAVTFSDLFVPDFGYSSIKDLLKAVESVSVIAGGGDTPSIVLLESDSGVNEEDEVEEEEENEKGKEDVRKPSFVSAKELKTSPARSQSYTRQRVNCSNTGMPVYVSFIKSPSCLSLQLISNDTSRALESLMEDTMLFYNSIEGEKLVLKSVPVVGEPVCAPYNSDGYWYRGEILSLPAPDTAEVYYVDYGNSAIIPRGSLRQPKAHYLALPAQALQARMANIQPAGASWSMRAATLLYQMTVDKPIIAIVTSVKNHCLSVCLCDTTSRKDVHINDRLVSLGLAVFEPDTVDDEASFDGYQLEPTASDSSVDIDQIRMPITSSSAATLSKGQGEVAQSNYQQNLIQLLLAQQNTLLLKQQSHMMSNTTSSSNHSGVPPPPGFGPVTQIHDSLPAISQSSLASSLPTPPPSSTTSSSSFSPPLTPSLPASASIPIPSVSTTPALPISSPSPSSPSLPSSSSLPTSCSFPAPSSPQSSISPSTATTSKSSAEGRPLIKRVDLTKSHSFHLLCYNESPFALSTEISKWFWKHDQLQGMLRRSQEHIWSLCLMKDSEPTLFQAMADCDVPMLQYVGKNKSSIIVYSLEDIPRIVKVFSGPDDLMQSILKIVDQWKEKGLEIFSEKSSDDLSEKLKRLQLMRTIILKKMVAKSSGHEEPLGEGSLEKLVIVEKEIAQVTNLLESTKPSNVPASATEEKGGAAALDSSNATYADSLIFSDLSEDSINTPTNSPSPPKKAPSHPPPPSPCSVGGPSLSQVPSFTSNNPMLSQQPGILPFPQQSHLSSLNYPLSQPVIPGRHGFIFPPAQFPVRTSQIQPLTSNWKQNHLPLPAPYYIPQGGWSWAQPLNAPVFHQPQVLGNFVRYNMPGISLSSSSAARSVPTLRKPTLVSQTETKKVSITAPTKPTSTSHLSSSAVHTTATSNTTTLAGLQPTTSTKQSGNVPQSSNGVQQSTTSNNTKLSAADVKISSVHQPTYSPPSNSSVSQQPSFIIQPSTSVSNPPTVSQPLTSISPQPAVSQPPTSVSRPSPLYSKVVGPTASKSVGLGRGKSLATLSPPSPRSVGVGRGHSTTEGWHTIQSRRNPITTPESFPPIGSGAGLDII